MTARRSTVVEIAPARVTVIARGTETDQMQDLD